MASAASASLLAPASEVARMAVLVIVNGTERSIWPSRITSIAPVARRPTIEAIWSCWSR